MQIITGDEIGILKLIDLEKKEITIKSKNDEQTNAKSKIQDIQMFEIENVQFLLALHQNKLSLLDLSLQEIANFQFEDSKQELNPFQLLICEEFEFVVICKSGIIMKMNYQNESNTFIITKQITIQSNKDKYITNAHISQDKQKLAISYFGCPPNIYAINDLTLIWNARNVRNDQYDLQVKMHDFDVQFLDDNSIGTLTIHKTIRIYDINKNKSQPISEFSLKNATNDLKHLRIYENKYFISNATAILIYDQQMNLIGKIGGQSGSVISFQMNGSRLFCISADRYFRIYDLETRKQLQSYYLSQRPSSFQIIQASDMEIEQIEKEKPIWTIQNSKEAKARFKGMRKHTIKLSYLNQMFQNHKNKKRSVKQEDVKREEQAIKEEYVEEMKNPFVIQKKKIDKKQRIQELRKRNLVNKPRTSK